MHYNKLQLSENLQFESQNTSIIATWHFILPVGSVKKVERVVPYSMNSKYQ